MAATVPFRHRTVVDDLRSGRRLQLPAIAYRKERQGVTSAERGGRTYAIYHFYGRTMVGGRTCEPHSMVIFEPGYPLYFGREDGSWTHTWIRCGGYAVRDMLGESGIPLNEALRVRTASHVERCVLELHDELTAHDRPDALILEAILTRFVREVSRAVRSGDAPASVPRELTDARRYIELHYNERITLTGLARRAAMSTQHFGMLFKKHYGTPPVELVIRLRMEEASHLLHDTSARVGEVAREVGYEDIYHFSKLFKRHVGVSPMAYRRGDAGR